MAKNGTQGEGDYKNAKIYQEAQREFAEKGPVEKKASEAEQALYGPEGAEHEAYLARHDPDGVKVEKLGA